MTFFNATVGPRVWHWPDPTTLTLETLYTTVGKPTCPYDSYKVVDRDGKELPTTTRGNSWSKARGSFTGYYRNPEENEKMFDKDGYFKTGDVAKDLIQAEMSRCWKDQGND